MQDLYTPHIDMCIILYTLLQFRNKSFKKLYKAPLDNYTILGLEDPQQSTFCMSALFNKIWSGVVPSIATTTVASGLRMCIIVSSFGADNVALSYISKQSRADEEGETQLSNSVFT